VSGNPRCRCEQRTSAKRAHEVVFAVHASARRIRQQENVAVQQARTMAAMLINGAMSAKACACKEFGVLLSRHDVQHPRVQRWQTRVHASVTALQTIGARPMMHMR